MTLPRLMSGVQLTRHGGPEALLWRDDIPVPTPGPGEVLVRVLAAGVNMTDINTRIGWYAADGNGGWAGAMALPRIQGADLCGLVVAQGHGVSAPPIGARVIASTCQPQPTAQNPMAIRVIGSEFDGAFAQFCVVLADHLHDVSASPLTDIEIGAMPCAYGTANNMLDRVCLRADERVLVTGASGGVGLAAVQLARLRGAQVSGQCSAAKAGIVAQAGAQILDRGQTPAPDSFDVVIDLVGGPDWAARLNALCPGGRYACAGAVGGPQVSGDLRVIYLKDLTLYGCTNQSPTGFADLCALINGGSPHPLVSKTYPLRDIAAAQTDLSAGRYPGKLVLLPPEIRS